MLSRASFCLSHIHLPAHLPSARLCSPRFSRLTPLQYYAGSDSCRASPARQVSPFRSLAFRTSHPHPRCAPGCHVPITSCIRSSLSVPGFTLHLQARRYTPPNRVRHPAGYPFASGCFPPRLAATQLPLATCAVISHGTNSHHADRSNSRTHRRSRSEPRRATARTGPIILRGPLRGRLRMTVNIK